jgi:hypothetical protein
MRRCLSRFDYIKQGICQFNTIGKDTRIIFMIKHHQLHNATQHRRYYPVIPAQLKELSIAYD